MTVTGGPFSRRKLATAVNTLITRLTTAQPEIALSTRLGTKVSKAAGASIANGETSIFTITGGRVLVTCILGYVTIVVQGQTTNIKVVYDPTTAGADTDLCAVVDCNAAAVGSYIALTGTIASAAVIGLLRANLQATPFILEAGAIHQNSSAASTGAISWDLWYFPIDSGATIVST